MSKNNHGKLLEYATYRCFKTYQARLLNQNPIRDSIDLKFEKNWQLISAAQRADFIKFANCLRQYFINRILPGSLITMPNDRAGVSGNVADIIIDRTNISLKNNRTYAKSQRPISLPAQLGLDSFDTAVYDMAYGQIAWQPWLDYGNEPCSSIRYKEELYEAIYLLTQTYLDQATPDQASKFFRFLSGEPHYQAINAKNDVLIYDMTKKPIPTSLSTSRSDQGHLIVAFNNGWTFSMRIHTASKLITRSLSLKFDTILVNQKELIKPLVFPKHRTT